MRFYRMAAIAALAITAACARTTGGPNGDSVDMTVGLNRQTAMQTARTQLVHHGFTVTGIGDEMLVTSPKAVPEYLREVSTAKQSSGQTWFLVVESSDVRFFRGTRLRVSGYLMPAGSGTAQAVRNGKRAEQNAIPITQQNPRLFREVEAVAGWIESGAQLKKKQK
ncbi:MAG TPA: hypothetical protein VHM30_06275 [Gemmatimonadaceae bacterium]|nr:hypothetical protein [Gemmatimonadaceae bacterium]